MSVHNFNCPGWCSASHSWADTGPKTPLRLLDLEATQPVGTSDSPPTFVKVVLTDTTAWINDATNRKGDATFILHLHITDRCLALNKDETHKSVVLQQLSWHGPSIYPRLAILEFVSTNAGGTDRDMAY